MDGYPWFDGEGRFPLPAYSEFMPAPRLGQRPYGEPDTSLFSEDDPFGWHIPEVEIEYEIQPGLVSLARQIAGEIVELGDGKSAYKIAGHLGRNLVNNPYWPIELSSQAGRLQDERYVILLPMALSRTQDDKGRVRWTFFGGSEQGPERAFWKSFFHDPAKEILSPERFFTSLLSVVYGQECVGIPGLLHAGFRILPSQFDPLFPHWSAGTVPSWTQALTWTPDEEPGQVRFLLTFRPFSQLPQSIRQRYLTGQLHLLPFPGSLVFWGMPSYRKLQNEFPFAMQLPLQRLVSRHGGPQGIKVPQSGWFHEPGGDFRKADVQERLLLNAYRRTSRWDRVRRHDNEVVLSTIEDSVARTLFGNQIEAMGLYGKPMARNCQIWTADSHMLLDGPNASGSILEQASRIVAAGGTFRYRFQFPAMRVGLHEMYWHRPLAAYRATTENGIELLPDSPLGYLTGYLPGGPDLDNPVELWPRLLDREPYRLALRNYGHLEEHYSHQTVLNILRVLDAWRRWGKNPLPRDFARQILRLPEREPLETWLDSLPASAIRADEGQTVRKSLEQCLEPSSSSRASISLTKEVSSDSNAASITYELTATRSFEEAWWNDIVKLSGHEYTNKDNADCVLDSATTPLLTHRSRDLGKLGDYLLERYRQIVLAQGANCQAIFGDLPFRWTTDFDFSGFGGWKINQTGHSHERDIILMIPGNSRAEAVVMADHYDTAYMEDLFEKSRGGTGARLSASGADDNYSATSTLLQAAPIFLELSRQGKLARDIWLVHLTGEEFPADCMGARHLARSLVEKRLSMRENAGKTADLSGVLMKGVFVLDMIGHNRDSYQDIFQISPGKGPSSLKLAWQAHTANSLWNTKVEAWNKSPERRGRGRGRRIVGGTEVPPTAEFLRLQGEVRLSEDPHSSLFNTDGQIFSDCGIPVVLFMENYDINRSGYHDTKDTMENIDLNYGAALAAIAIETVARAAVDSRA
jgi:hypothetical protein